MRLVIERGKTALLSALPPRSIALDGYVQGPAIDADRERYSFDHHAGCLRQATRASCEQACDAVLLGLDPSGFSVFLNDIDLDTALAVWVLANPRRASEPVVRDLVSVVGRLDAFTGAYPTTATERSVVDWLSEPETRARADGTYWSLDDAGLGQLLRDVSHRIELYTRGKAPASSEHFVVDDRYEIVQRGTGWVLVRVIGVRANAAVFRDGYTRVVIYRQLPDGTYAYTIAKQSDLVKRFPVDRILAALSVREPGWGGGSSIGGAPRRRDGSRSRLTPGEVFEIVEGVVSGV